MAGTGPCQACCLGQRLIRSQAVTSGLQAPSQGCRAVSVLLGLEPRWPPPRTAGGGRQELRCARTNSRTRNLRVCGRGASGLEPRSRPLRPLKHSGY